MNQSFYFLIIWNYNWVFQRYREPLCDYWCGENYCNVRYYNHETFFDMLEIKLIKPCWLSIFGIYSNITSVTCTSYRLLNEVFLAIWNTHSQNIKSTGLMTLFCILILSYFLPNAPSDHECTACLCRPCLKLFYSLPIASPATIGARHVCVGPAALDRVPAASR